MGRMNCGWQRGISPLLPSYYQHSTAGGRLCSGLRSSYVSSVRTSDGYETDETDPVVCKGYRRLPQTGGSDADKEELAPITGTN